MLTPFDQLTFSGSRSYVNPSNEQFLFLLNRKKNGFAMTIFFEKTSPAQTGMVVTFSWQLDARKIY
jgi:hypothetical protein